MQLEMQSHQQFVGGMPIENVINRIVKFLRKKTAKLGIEPRFVDFGSGRGLVSALIEAEGYANIIAIDDNSEYDNDKFFKSEETYVQKPNDVLFICWGRNFSKIVEQFINNGGTDVIIIGEESGGCTFPCDYMEIHPTWHTKKYEVPRSAGLVQYMTISTTFLLGALRALIKK
jgi:hypothetical protein